VDEVDLHAPSFTPARPNALYLELFTLPALVKRRSAARTCRPRFLNHTPTDSPNHTHTGNVKQINEQTTISNDTSKIMRSHQLSQMPPYEEISLLLTSGVAFEGIVTTWPGRSLPADTSAVVQQWARVVGSTLPRPFKI